MTRLKVSAFALFCFAIQKSALCMGEFPPGYEPPPPDGFLPDYQQAVAVQVDPGLQRFVNDIFSRNSAAILGALLNHGVSSLRELLACNEESIKSYGINTYQAGQLIRGIITYQGEEGPENFCTTPEEKELCAFVKSAKLSAGVSRMLLNNGVGSVNDIPPTADSLRKLGILSVHADNLHRAVLNSYRVRNEKPVKRVGAEYQEYAQPVKLKPSERAPADAFGLFLQSNGIGQCEQALRNAGITTTDKLSVVAQEFLEIIGIAQQDRGRVWGVILGLRQPPQVEVVAPPVVQKTKQPNRTREELRAEFIELLTQNKLIQYRYTFTNAGVNTIRDFKQVDRSLLKNIGILAGDIRRIMELIYSLVGAESN